MPARELKAGDATRSALLKALKPEIAQQKSLPADFKFDAVTKVYIAGDYAAVKGNVSERPDLKIVGLVKKSGSGWSKVEWKDGEDLAGLVRAHPEAPQSLAR